MPDFKFKVGDRVKLNQDYCQLKVGHEGVVTGIQCQDSGRVLVWFTDYSKDSNYGAYEHRLDLVEEPKPVPKFKVGDKVRQSEPYAYKFCGKPLTVGTILEVNHEAGAYNHSYRVDFSDVGPAYKDWDMSDCELELVQSVESVNRESLVGAPQVAEPDPVSNPSHYTSGQIECIDYIQSVLSTEEFRGWLRGNIIKYQHRYRLKGSPVEDLRKIEFYTKRLISLEGEF